MTSMRRMVVVTLALAILLTPFAAEAQPAGKVHRIGILGTGASPRLSELFRESLRDLGYVEGLNVAVEWRSVEGKVERFDELAAELVRLKVDVIVAPVPAAVFAARRVTTTIPIVMVNTPDPVQLGLVASLRRPGGNITGTTSLTVDLSIKQLELLREAVPRASRIAVLWNSTNPWHPLALKGIEGGARSLGVQLQILQVGGPERPPSGVVLMVANPFHYTTGSAASSISTDDGTLSKAEIETSRLYTHCSAV